MTLSNFRREISYDKIFYMKMNDIKQEHSFNLGILTFHIHLPGCNSLKDKRSQIKPVLSRLQRTFNISIAEVGKLDSWQESILTCAFVSNNRSFTQKTLQSIIQYAEKSWPGLYIADHEIELI